MLIKRSSGQSSLFVSVGAGANQLLLINEAIELGFQVIGIDADPMAAGMTRCHIRIQESMYDYESIYVKISESLIEGRIRAVMTKSYGQAVKTASFLSEKFGLRLLPFARSGDFIVKERMKQVFAANGIPTPPGHVMEAGRIKVPSRMTFPLVIKPVTGHGKRGVALLSDDADLRDYLSGVSPKSGSFLVEQFIEGDEIIAAGIVHEGAYHLVDISDKVTSLPPHFIDLIHISPSRHFDLMDRVSEIGQKIADAFEIANSPLIIEMLVTPPKDIYVIEAVPEFGGECLPDRLIPGRTGYNFVREAILAVSGGKFTPPSPRPSGKSMVVRYLTGRAGTFNGADSVVDSEGLVYSKLFATRGQLLSRPVTNHDRIAVVIAQGKSRCLALANAEQAAESLNIRIAGGKPA